MKLSEFIRDKTVYILCHLLAFSLTISMIVIFIPQNTPAIGILVAIVLIGAAVAPLIWEYSRKKRFYSNLLAIFESLERKNLLIELIAPPSFQEGQILYDLLRRSNKACLDEINQYKFMQADYREYIELWVHEIKSPIASARLIIQNNPGAIVASLAEELAKIESFVEQSLYYSRSNVVEKDYLVRQINLQNICRNVLQKNAGQLIQRRISIETNGLDQVVFCDAKWLEYIINQLVSNALKYMRPDDARIIFSGRRQYSSVILEVSDNGIGIAAGELPRIFDKGFTGTNGRQQERSTGMGLYICRRLCDKLGLAISAESDGLSGTTIRIVFPVDAMSEVAAQQ